MLWNRSHKVERLVVEIGMCGVVDILNMVTALMTTLVTTLVHIPLAVITIVSIELWVVEPDPLAVEVMAEDMALVEVVVVPLGGQGGGRQHAHHQHTEHTPQGSPHVLQIYRLQKYRWKRQRCNVILIKE